MNGRFRLFVNNCIGLMLEVLKYRIQEDYLLYLLCDISNRNYAAIWITLVKMVGLEGLEPKYIILICCMTCPVAVIVIVPVDFGVTAAAPFTPT